MRAVRPRLGVGAAVLAIAIVGVAAAAAAVTDPLPSWNEGTSKARIVAFVERTTDPLNRDFVPPNERIAVFDNDGTLWVEQPMYTQLAFAIDRARAMAAKDPALAEQPAIKAAVDGDIKALAALGEKGLVELIATTHAGMTTDAFAQIVRDWARTARHPRFKRPYTELTYQPMRELLDYLRANGYQTWIVSGGGIEFMRVFAREIYGVPPEQVVGSTGRTRYEVRDGQPMIVRLPEIEFIDDKEGKPLGIQRAIGERPIAAFGNSDGDFQMLEWTTAARGPRLGAFVHHDDAEREYAYDRQSPIGRLDRGLDEAAARGWIVISMKNDWNAVFAPANQELP